MSFSLKLGRFYKDGGILQNEEVCDLLNKYADENEQLKSELQQEQELNADLCNMNLHILLEKKNKEIEQLKQRNQRQAEQLSVYKLIAKKDGEALTRIITDFKRCDEQL